MYKDFFGFKAAAFGVTPDVRFFYDNGVHRAILAKLHRAIDARSGLALVTGDAGTGKTILLRKVMHDLGDRARSVYLFDPLVDFEQLLRLTLSALGLRNFALDRLTMMNRLSRYLMEQRLAERVVCLIVDEAQDCSVELLNELRHLSNLEAESDKLLQIILVGQCTLERHLDRPELLQLRQRIALRCRLNPLPVSEVEGYITSRLRLADYHGQPLFDAASIEGIAQHSQGIPRLINTLCDHALEAACAAAASRVQRSTIDAVARELALVSNSRQLKPGVTLIDEQSQREPEHDIQKSVAEPNPRLQTSNQEFNFECDYSLVDADGRPIGSDRHRHGLGLSMTAMLMIAIVAVVLAPLIYPHRARYSLAALIEEFFPNYLIDMPFAKLSPQPEKALDKVLEDANLPATPDLTSPLEKANGQQISTPPTNGDMQAAEPSVTVPAREDGAPIKNPVEPNRSKLSPAPSSNGARQPTALPAEDLEARVAKAVHNRAIEGVEISVRNGLVILGGRVATLRQKLVAGRAARSVAGAELVQNEIIVDSNVAKPFH